MSDSIDIKGLDKAVLLAALYNNSKPLGLGFLQADPKPMTPEEAACHIAREGLRFDYLKGRVMKVNLEGDSLDPWGYDRDLGEGHAASVVENLKAGLDYIPETQNRFGKLLDAFLEEAKPTSVQSTEGFVIIEIGVSQDLLDALQDARQKFDGPK